MLSETGMNETLVKLITGEKTTQMVNKYVIGVRQSRMAKEVGNIWKTEKQQKYHYLHNSF